MKFGPANFLVTPFMLLIGSLLIFGTTSNAQPTCDPSLGPCAKTKTVGKVNKESWPSFDASCGGQDCKIIMTNEYIQVGGTRLPREIVITYSMEDKSDYSCTVFGRPCNPILNGSIYYTNGEEGGIEAATFEFRNTKPAIKLNAEMKEWLGDQ